MIAKIRTWLLIKLAAGNPVAINVELFAGGIRVQRDSKFALFVNVRVIGNEPEPNYAKGYSK